jgi:hypothetical protein
MSHAEHRLKTETSKVAGKKSRASSRFFYAFPRVWITCVESDFFACHAGLDPRLV